MIVDDPVLIGVVLPGRVEASSNVCVVVVVVGFVLNFLEMRVNLKVLGGNVCDVVVSSLTSAWSPSFSRRIKMTFCVIRLYFQEPDKHVVLSHDQWYAVAGCGHGRKRVCDPCSRWSQYKNQHKAEAQVGSISSYDGERRCAIAERGTSACCSPQTE